MFKFYNMNSVFPFCTISSHTEIMIIGHFVILSSDLVLIWWHSKAKKQISLFSMDIHIWSNKSHYQRVHIWKQHTQAAPFRFKLYVFSNITKNAFDARTVHISFLFSIVPFFLLIRFIEIIGCCIIANRNIADNTACVCVCGVCVYHKIYWHFGICVNVTKVNL